MKLEKRGKLIRGCANLKGLNDKFVRVTVRKREERGKLLKKINYFLSNNCNFKNYQGNLIKFPW